jgi:hypothetical protein
VNYSDQIEHPSGALNPPIAWKPRQSWMAWILFVVAVALFFAWRAGLCESYAHPRAARTACRSVELCD